MKPIYTSFPSITTVNNQYGSIHYKEYHGTSYHLNTPDELVSLLERIRTEKTRVIIHYGNHETGSPWGDTITGRLGRSAGKIQVPIILATSRSTGGEALLDNCIVKIVESKGKKVLYSLS